MLWLNGTIIYKYRDTDPAYSYYFGNGLYKIYFPFRKEKRFITNTNSGILQGFDQLPETYDFLIITKALKDVMCLNSLGVPAVAPQAEGNIIPKELIQLLKPRFNNIYSLLDFDYAGIKSANRLRREENIEALFLTNGRFNTLNYGAKDPAEYLKINGVDNTMNLIKDIYNHYME
jgi:DNA primase